MKKEKKEKKVRKFGALESSTQSHEWMKSKYVYFYVGYAMCMNE